MTKSLKNLWARLLFRDRGILPSIRLLVLFVLFSVAITLVSLTGVEWIWLLVTNVLFLLVTLLDLLYSPRKRELTFHRMIPEELERGIVYQVKVDIHNRSSHACVVKLVDGLPQSFQTASPLTRHVDGKGSVTISYEIVAPIRGKYEVRQQYIRYTSLFGLWEKQMKVDITDEVKVIPDLTEAKQYLESAQQFLMYEGLKIRKQKSSEGEFSQIRNYVVGDDPRKINWRQTAKMQEMMTNEYEPEHGKYITILIDCGRMMGAELEKGNLLDKVLEAALTVTTAALKNGDYVAVLAFSKEVKVFIPPEKGMDHMQRILRAIYHLDVDASESNYPAVLNYLQMVQKKRSLILLFSDVHTFLHEESGLQYLKRLRRRHLFLMIGIENKELLDKAALEPGNVQTTMLKSIAQQQIQTKKREKANWERQGLLMVEAAEERLATAAVSHYIHIMNQGLL